MSQGVDELKAGSRAPHLWVVDDGRSRNNIAYTTQVQKLKVEKIYG